MHHYNAARRCDFCGCGIPFAWKFELGFGVGSFPAFGYATIMQLA